MTDSYPVSAYFLSTVYAWQGHSHRFPNAKLFEAGSEAFFAYWCPDAAPRSTAKK
jgi:hypothetical protein